METKTNGKRPNEEINNGSGKRANSGKYTDTTVIVFGTNVCKEEVDVMDVIEEAEFYNLETGETIVPELLWRMVFSQPNDFMIISKFGIRTERQHNVSFQFSKQLSDVEGTVGRIYEFTNKSNHRLIMKLQKPIDDRLKEQMNNDKNASNDKEIARLANGIGMVVKTVSMIGGKIQLMEMGVCDVFTVLHSRTKTESERIAILKAYIIFSIDFLEKLTEKKLIYPDYKMENVVYFQCNDKIEFRVVDVESIYSLDAMPQTIIYSADSIPIFSIPISYKKVLDNTSNEYFGARKIGKPNWYDIYQYYHDTKKPLNLFFKYWMYFMVYTILKDVITSTECVFGLESEQYQKIRKIPDNFWYLATKMVLMPERTNTDDPKPYLKPMWQFSEVYRQAIRIFADSL
jgi:hypothetical protein